MLLYIMGFVVICLLTVIAIENYRLRRDLNSILRFDEDEIFPNALTAPKEEWRNQIMGTNWNAPSPPKSGLN